MSYKSTHTGAQIDAGVSAALNPDATPTLSSTNLVTSGGVAAKLSEKQDTLVFDNAPASGSNNPVKSGGIYTALEGKASNVALALKAPLDSPTLTGTPTAPTPAAGDSSTKVATTAFVGGAVSPVQALAQYLALREEEDRQMILGSVAEVVEDSYSELRSAPIHNSITIGQNVYPRMDNTRLGLETIKGRTVAFNQLVRNGNFADSSNWTVNSATISISGNVASVTASVKEGGIQQSISCISGHIYAAFADVKTTGGNSVLMRGTGGVSIVARAGASTAKQMIGAVVSATSSADISLILRDDRASNWDAVEWSNVMVVDLTLDYGSTIADSIYAMEQSTPGSGVAYVRQRLPLDYYAYNAGELTAPEVSGVEVTGKNLLDKATYITSTSTSWKSFALQLLPNTQYTVSTDNTGSHFKVFATNTNLGSDASVNNGSPVTFTTNGVALVTFGYYSSSTAAKKAPDYNYQLELGATASAYTPYLSTSLSLPSTTLNGVGTAQDYIEAVEVGENDYSLIKHTVMGEVDLGTLEWTRITGYTHNGFKATLSFGSGFRAICSKYMVNSSLNGETTFFNGADDKTIGGHFNGNTVYVRDDSYSDAGAFTTALNGVKLCVRVGNDAITTTTIAEHLTLAEVSAIAENGGIIGIINSNGDIVQPDLTVDTVISKSAS